MDVSDVSSAVPDEARMTQRVQVVPTCETEKGMRTQDSEIGYRAGDRSRSQESCFADFLAEELQLSDKILNT